MLIGEDVLNLGVEPFIGKTYVLGVVTHSIAETSQ